MFCIVMQVIAEEAGAMVMLTMMAAFRPSDSPARAAALEYVTVVSFIHARSTSLRQGHPPSPFPTPS
jgi:hypothetical protein